MRSVLVIGLLLFTEIQSQVLDRSGAGVVEDERSHSEMGSDAILEEANSDRYKSKSDSEQTGMIGSPLPTIEGTKWFNVEGPLTRDEMKGKVVLIDFWGIRCGPCVASLPKVQQLHERFLDSGLIVLGVHTASYGTEAEVAEFIAEHGLTYPIVIGTEATFERFGQWALPTYFLVDRDGNLNWGYSSKLPWKRQIRALLGDRRDK